MYALEAGKSQPQAEKVEQSPNISKQDSFMKEKGEQAYTERALLQIEE